MSAQFAKDEMSFVMPASVSHAGEPATSRSLVARVGDAVQWLVDLPRRRAVLNELNALSDHELADIGLTRADVPYVFDRTAKCDRSVPRGAAL